MNPCWGQGRETPPLTRYKAWVVKAESLTEIVKYLQLPAKGLESSHFAQKDTGSVVERFMGLYSTNKNVLHHRAEKGFVHDEDLDIPVSPQGVCVCGGGGGGRGLQNKVHFLKMENILPKITDFTV